ncbi:MAG: hypothetical protein PHS46_00510 [Candidatus Omnitrophica bacterium]|nr:hypothetical protein [Candidatus Omnitrophota bacterium]
MKTKIFGRIGCVQIIGVTIMLFLAGNAMAYTSISENDRTSNSSSSVFSPGYLNIARYQAEAVMHQNNGKQPGMLDKILEKIGLLNKSPNAANLNLAKKKPESKTPEKITPVLKQKSSARGQKATATATIILADGTPAIILGSGNILHAYKEGESYYFDIIKNDGSNEVLLSKQAISTTTIDDFYYQRLSFSSDDYIDVQGLLLSNGSLALVVRNSDSTTSVEVLNSYGNISNHFAFDANTEVTSVYFASDPVYGDRIGIDILDRLNNNTISTTASLNSGDSTSIGRIWSGGYYETGQWHEGSYVATSYESVDLGYMDVQVAGYGTAYGNVKGLLEYYTNGTGEKVYTGVSWYTGGMFVNGTFWTDYSYDGEFFHKGYLSNTWDGMDNSYYSWSELSADDWYSLSPDSTITMSNEYGITQSYNSVYLDAYSDPDVWIPETYTYDSITTTSITPINDYGVATLAVTTGELISLYNIASETSNVADGYSLYFGQDTENGNRLYDITAKNNFSGNQSTYQDGVKMMPKDEVFNMIALAALNSGAIAPNGEIASKEETLGVMSALMKIMSNPSEDQKTILDAIRALVGDVNKIEAGADGNMDPELKKAQNDLLQAVTNILLAQAMPDLLKKGDMANIKEVFSELENAKCRIINEYAKSTKPYYDNILKDLAKNMALLQLRSILKPNITQEELEKLPPSELDKILDRIRKSNDSAFEVGYIQQQEAKYRQTYLDPNKRKLHEDMKGMMQDFTKKLGNTLKDAEAPAKK